MKKKRCQGVAVPSGRMELLTRAGEPVSRDHKTVRVVLMMPVWCDVEVSHDDSVDVDFTDDFYGTFKTHSVRTLNQVSTVRKAEDITESGQENIDERAAVAFDIVGEEQL